MNVEMLEEFPDQRQPSVILSCNKDKVPVDTVNFLDIKEDIFGRDVLFYCCPVCKNKHESFVL